MKAAFRLLVLLAAAPACRATAPTERNALPRNRPLTEMTTPERGEPSRRTGLTLPDTSRRELPEKP